MERAPKTLNYIKIFFIIIFLAATVSLSYKVFISFKNSTFRFGTLNVLIVQDSPYLIHIDSAEKKLQILEFKNQYKTFINKTRFYEALKLGIPIDSQIVLDNRTKILLDSNFMNITTLLSLLLRRGYKFDNIDNIDIFKIFYTTKQISSNDRIFNSLDGNVESYITGNPLDFSDREIFNSGKSIQIINATNINGLGDRFASTLRNLGYNVVSVITGESNKSSIASSFKNDISLKRLQLILGFPVTNKTSGSVADITVTLGEELAPQLKGVF